VGRRVDAEDNMYSPYFKLKITDLNCSIYSPYQTLVVNQIVYFFKNFAIFWVGRKSSLLNDPKSLNQVIFSYPKK
jgi:hypothetical protein